MYNTLWFYFYNLISHWFVILLFILNVILCLLIVSIVILLYVQKNEIKISVFIPDLLKDADEETICIITENKNIKKYLVSHNINKDYYYILFLEIFD